VLVLVLLLLLVVVVVVVVVLTCCWFFVFHVYADLLQHCLNNILHTHTFHQHPLLLLLFIHTV